MNKIYKTIFAIFALVLMIVNVSAATYSRDDEDARVTVQFLNQDPDPADPGDYVELRWTVTKFGNEKMDLEFELMPEYPFSFDASDDAVKTIENWAGFSDEDEYYILYYKLKIDDNAIEGSYDVDLRYRNKNNKNEPWIVNDYTIRVDEKDRPSIALGEIKSTPIKLLADTNENQLDVEILNIGDAKAEHVFVDLELPEGFESSYSYSTEDNLGNIEAHMSSVSNMFIDIEKDVLPGNYEGTLNIKFKEEEEDEYIKIEEKIILEVKDKPNFEIESVSFNDESIAANDKVEMKIQIKNTASKKADSVSIRAFKEASQPFDFDEKSDYVGTLDTDENGEAIIVFTVDSDAKAKKYILDYEIRSVYNDQVFIQNEKATITVDERVGGSNTKLILGVGLVLVVVVAFVFFFLNGKKNNKKRR
jgi:hypothetical protein